MRTRIPVQVSKALQTYVRNMRRRKTSSWLPSPLPILLVVALFTLFKSNDVTPERTIIPVSTSTAENWNNGTVVAISKKPAKADVDAAVERRYHQYMDRRHKERRAVHTRIRGNQKIGTVVVQKHHEEEHHHERTTTSETAKEPVVDHQESPQHDKPARQNVRTNHTSEHANTGGVPAGARIHGKLADYGGSLGGTSDGMVRGQNVTRVSYTLFKVMKLFGFVSLVDSPAGQHAEWMPKLVERMSFDHPSFRYTALDDAEGVARAREGIGELVDGEYITGDAERVSGNGSDIVLHWTELDGGQRDARSKDYAEHIRKVLVTAKKGDNGYIVFAQFPTLNGPQPTYRKGKWVFAGDDSQPPFLYNSHVRGVVPVGNGRQNYMSYMTFYSLRSIPMTELLQTKT